MVFSDPRIPGQFGFPKTQYNDNDDDDMQMRMMMMVAMICG